MKAKNEKIYISGKIIGMLEEAMVMFKRAETILKDKGYWKIINPTMYQFQQNYRDYLKKDGDYKKGGYQVFMKKALRDLLNSDIIVMLPNWALSEGAMLEKSVAEMLKMPIYFVELTTGELTEYKYGESN